MNRKPRLTHKTMMALLAVQSLAQADADMMDTPQEREHQQEVYLGCEYISKLAAHWAAKHGCEWPNKYARKNGGGR